MTGSMKLAGVCFASVVLAVVFSQGVSAQQQDNVLSTIMYQNYNYTTRTVGFSICNNYQPLVGVVPANMSGNEMVPISNADANNVNVDARWFGGTYGAASNFQIVSNCSVLQLTSNGGHGTTFYTGSVPDAPNGCTASWFQSPNYLTLFVNITDTANAWSVSLPTNSSYRPETSCNAGYEHCPLATGLQCTDLLALPTTLKPDGSPSPQAAAGANAPQQSVAGLQG